ncbi:ABC transporter substrate-binding protein [Bacillota bacterium LX-D]|nr:ABC transporter substrate-binding protein [Bacillota bacterium LX-D]
MKKVISLLGLMVLLAVAAFGCGGQNTQTDKKATAGENGQVVKVGIIQITEHPALDAARQGFIESLKEKGYTEGKNLEIDYQNAQGDQSNLKTIAQKFVTDKKDLILAIATPSAITMAGETDQIPILITAVTDPVAAKLVKSNEEPGGNITGTTDMTPVKEQLELLQKIAPKVKKVGVLYNSSEINSEIQADIARKAAATLGLQVTEATVTGSAEVQQIAQSLAQKVDAIYVPTDNVVASSIASVVSVAEEKHIPLVVGEKGMVEGGALATVGIDYYKLGRQTGDMAVRVLKGEDPAKMPIEKLKDSSIVINKKAARSMGVTIPQDILAKAQVVE